MNPSLSRTIRTGLDVLTRHGSKVIYRLGLYHLAARRYAGLGVILMLHRVVKPGEAILDPGYCVSLDVLENVLQWVRHMGWEAVSISEAHRRLLEGRTQRRFVCFTFDDGYRDNLTLALPLFRSYQTPMLVALATSALDRTLFYWWGGLTELVMRESRIEAPATADTPALSLAAGNVAEKMAAYQTLDRFGHQFPATFLPMLRDLFDRYRIDLAGLVDRDFLSIAEARQLASDPLVTIASHSVTHRRLADLPEEDVRTELLESRRRLEEWTGRHIRHFTYPYGGPAACGRREFALAREAGYQVGLTTRRGSIFPEHAGACLGLPRQEIPLDHGRYCNRLFGVEAPLKGNPRLQLPEALPEETGGRAGTGLA
jgi:peptidoglycan/xylan/chitin deacetylase (PgdA/CDA1 family)